MSGQTFLRQIQGLVLAVFLLQSLQLLASENKNGFELGNSIINNDEILYGGPPKDGIPALHQPQFIKADEADYLKPEDRILGIVIDDVAKAYPIKILNWHEIVNDKINDKSFAVTYCPLCGTGVAFDAKLENHNLQFGVSGLLYNSDVLLYDKNTESLWSQILAKSVSGNLVGKELTILPVSHTSWKKWRKDHPLTDVLSTKTGYSRNYQRNPYQGYQNSKQLYFSVKNRSPDRYHPKEIVLGISIDQQFKAYPFIELDMKKQTVIDDRFANKNLKIHWDSENRSAHITDTDGQYIPSIQGYWFSWYAFHPDTQVYEN